MAYSPTLSWTHTNKHERQVLTKNRYTSCADTQFDRQRDKPHTVNIQVFSDSNVPPWSSNLEDTIAANHTTPRHREATPANTTAKPAHTASAGGPPPRPMAELASYHEEPPRSGGRHTSRAPS